MATLLAGRNLRDFWILTLGQGLMYCGFFAYFQFPLYVKHVGGSERDIGLMMGSAALASTLLIPWISDFVNRVERRAMMLAGTALLTLSTLACLTLSHAGAWMAALMMLRGFGFGVYANASGAYLADLMPPSERSRWLGINFGFNQIAVALGPAAAELVIGRVGFPAFFLMSAGFVGAGMLFIWRISARQPKAAPPPLRPIPIAREFFADLVSPRYRSLIGTLLLMACGLGAVFNFTATYVTPLGLSSGLFFLVYAGVNAFTRIAGGSLSDRYGRPLVIIPTLLLFSGGVLLYSFVGGVGTMVVSALCIGLGFGMCNPAILAQLLDRAPSGQGGRVIGAFNFAYQLGTLCATPLFGQVAAQAGYQAMWHIAFAATAAAALIYTFSERRVLRFAKRAEEG